MSYFVTLSASSGIHVSVNARISKQWVEIASRIRVDLLRVERGLRRPNFTKGDGFWGCMSKAGLHCQAVRPILSRTCCLYTGQEEDVVTWSWQGRFDLKQGTQKGGEDLEQLSDGWSLPQCSHTLGLWHLAILWP